MIKRADGDDTQVLDVSSCSSGAEEISDDDVDLMSYEEWKKKFDLKVLAEKFFLKRDSFIFKLTGSIEDYYEIFHVLIYLKLKETALGEGAFGKVLKANHKLLNIERAVKVIPKHKILNHERFKYEIDALKLLVFFIFE